MTRTFRDGTIVYCLRTADKASDTDFGDSSLLRDLQGKQRADERTRTAFPLQLRVCGQWLLSLAQLCKSRINKRLSVPSIARYCRVLRVG
jgi:hypothetical protein